MGALPAFPSTPALIKNLSHAPVDFDKTTLGILLAGWCFYLVFAPIYLFKSGLPQPSDYMVLSVSALSMTLYFFKNEIMFNRVFTTLCLMVGLFFTVNIIYYSLYHHDTKFLLAAIYYIFNAAVFTATCLLFKVAPTRLRFYARIAIFISLVLEFLWIKLIGGSSQWRETGSFNNPNQLGYWALLSACYILVLNYNQRMKWFDLIGFLICSYIVTEALSRAVIVSYGLLFILFMMGSYVSIMTKMIMGLLVFGYALIQMTIFQHPSFLIDNFEVIQRIITRVESISSQGNAFTERGYERIIHYPHYLLFGAGEGYYQRFASGLELHSGLGTILFSYGVFGFTLFSMFIIGIFYRVPWPLWLTLAAIMLYGITHQHVRFTGFWIYLGLIYGMSRYIIPHHQKPDTK